MKAARGFSLIELMIAVAIIGILAAIALPAYNQSVVKANRRNAQAFLMEIAQREQQYLLDNRAYVAAADLAAISSNLHVSAPAEVTRLYTVAITTAAGPPATFTITATPNTSNKKQNADGAITLNSAGAKTPVDKW